MAVKLNGKIKHDTYLAIFRKLYWKMCRLKTAITLTINASVLYLHKSYYSQAEKKKYI